MRELIYVPVVHTEVDMGSLQEAVKEQFLSKYHERDWQKLSNAVHEFWEGVQQRIMGLQLKYQETHIYQDGLPVCGKEVQIVTDLAERGSYNHKLLLQMVERGSHLVGTESPELLLEEYRLLQRVFSTPQGEQREAAAVAYRNRAPDLLKERDEYIRRRIDDTLPESGVGILFIGLIHRADECLPDDIRVSYLIHNVPFDRSGEIKRL